MIPHRNTLRRGMGEARKPAAGAPASATAAPSPTSAGPAPSTSMPTKTKMISIGSSSITTRLNTLEQVLDNMSVKTGTGVILAGSTGIGKTTFVKQLGKLLGLNVELIEVPHITEEHLINIPFITFKPNGTSSPGEIRLDPTNIQVTLAQSHLASILRSTKAVDDSTYIANTKRFDANTRAIYQQLGGDESTIPEELAGLRKRFRTILFLDEYWRQTSMNVRNILRGILNGRIGNDRIPPGVYVVFASNVSDVGSSIEDIPLNADFKMIDFKAPTKDEFFHYLISSSEDKGIKLNPELINAFHAALDDSHISYDDVEQNIRTSPRRWEQILLYINAALPVDSSQKAKALLANIEANFRNEQQTSELHQLVDVVVRDVIAKTGGDQFKDEKALEPSQWRSVLEHQIAMKMKMGDSRTYIPVVMGAPGIGKTSQMADIADRLNLRLIVIDASTLTADDITGIPVPKREVAEAAEDTLSVGFAEPALFKRITADAQEEDEAFLGDPDIPAEKKAAYKAQRFKYLLFFDELNRVGNQNVFNSLRRVILDKSFNDQTHLPDSMIIVAAMNPEDKGTAELTGHLKDAVDLIDTMPSWSALQDWMDSSADASMGLEQFPEVARQTARKIIDGFAARFAIKISIGKIGLDALKFHIKLGEGEGDMLYISPREYSTMYAELVAGYARVLKKLDPDVTKHEDQIYKAIMQKLEATLKWIMLKHKIDSPQFLLAVASWLQEMMPQFMIKQRDTASLEIMLDEVLKDPNKHLKDNPNFVNYAKNFDRTKFTEDVTNYFQKLMEQEKNKYDLWAKAQVSAKRIEAGKVKIVNELISKLEAVNSEIYTAADAFDLGGDLVDTLDHALIDTLKRISDAVKLPDSEADNLIDKALEMLGRLRWTR